MSGMLKYFRKHAPELKVVGLVDANPEAAKARLSEEDQATVRFFDTLDDLVREAKPDALAIGTRCDSHTPHAIEAAKYDLPLYLEKPVSNSMAQAIALEKAFQNTRCKALVSFPLRASMLCERAKHLLNRGAVGRIDHVNAVNYVSYGNVYFDSWYRDYSITQGLFLQKATHDFDYLSYLVGAPIVKVAAMASHGRVFRDTKTIAGSPDPDAIYLDGIGTPEEGMNEDSSSALLEFANGAKGVYTQAFFTKRLSRRGATLSGYRGSLEFDWYQGKITTFDHQEPFTNVCTATETDSHFGGDDRLAKNFISMIREGAEPQVPIGLGLESVYSCLAAKESAETGQFVKVRQLGAAC